MKIEYDNPHRATDIKILIVFHIDDIIQNFYLRFAENLNCSENRKPGLTSLTSKIPSTCVACNQTTIPITSTNSSVTQTIQIQTSFEISTSYTCVACTPPYFPLTSRKSIVNPSGFPRIPTTITRDTSSLCISCSTSSAQKTSTLVQSRSVTPSGK